MGEVITVELDIAKHVFQIHGIDKAGSVVIRQKLRRSEVLHFLEELAPCLVGIEACATAHHWVWSLISLGHHVELVSPTYVKPCVKRQKNDAADAEAICETVTRLTMRFVPVKGKEQQGIGVLHRARELLIRQRTMPINALRAHLAEFGIVVPQGRVGVTTLVTLVADDEHDLIPGIAREKLLAIVDQLRNGQERIAAIERSITTWHRSNAQSRRLETIPGVGPITASAIAATVADASMFRSGRELAAWIGLVPQQSSSGGKERLGHISKKGDRYLRRLLFVRAHAVLRYARKGKASSTNGRHLYWHVSPTS